MGHDFVAYSATAREPIPKDKRRTPARLLPEPEQSRRVRDLMTLPNEDRQSIVALMLYTGKARSRADGNVELLADGKHTPEFNAWLEERENDDNYIGVMDTEVVLRLPDNAQAGDNAATAAPTTTTFEFSCGYGSCDEVMGCVRQFSGNHSLRFPPDELRDRAWAQRVLIAMCAAAPSVCAAKGLASGVPEGEATAWFRLPEWSAPNQCKDGWFLEVYHGLGRLCLVACMTPTGVISCF